MIGKIVLWIILLAIESVTYPTLYNMYLEVTSDPMWYSNNAFLRWDLVFATRDGVQMWAAFNVVLLIIVIVIANNKSSMANASDNEGAYGTARFMGIDELNSLYPSYEITSDQKKHTGLYRITKRFKTKSEANRWKKKK